MYVPEVRVLKGESLCVATLRHSAASLKPVEWHPIKAGTIFIL